MFGPFAISGVIIMYEVHSLQKTLCHTDKFANDPLNPYYADIQAKKHKTEH
ncbi:hypothetical protein BB561_006907 [Smittium simulii]|uniref:Uncharacterized protein n=1 Tax=Smittium simulii TaxID=133385 RepID=A0A2T9Y083_9FUNG|nr:hypothetical protein BB561_006907 [Smittium simulii]